MALKRANKRVEFGARGVRGKSKAARKMHNRSKNGRFTDCGERAEIIRRTAAGEPVRKVARMLQRAPKTIRNVVARQRDAQAPRRRAAVSAKQKEINKRRALLARIARKALAQKKILSTKKFAQMLRTGKAKLDVSEETVRTDLIAMNIRSYVRPKRSRSHLPDARKRALFAKWASAKPKSWFERIIITDEKIFDTNDHGHVRCWAPSELKHHVPHRAQDKYPIKLMVAGAIGIDFRSIVVLKGTSKKKCVTSKDYAAQVLGPLFRRRSSLRRAHPNFVWQQDGAKIHWALPALKEFRKIATKESARDPNGVEIIGFEPKSGRRGKVQWPPRSPDLSPIENLWADVQKRVSLALWDVKDVKQPQLEAEVIKQWYAVPVATVNRYVRSFAARTQKCAAKGGEWVGK